VHRSSGFLAATLLSFLLPASAVAGDAPTVVVYPRPDKAPASSDFAVTVAGKAVPLYRHNRVSFAYFDFGGGPVDVRVEVRCTRRLSLARILPERLASTPVVDAEKRLVTFRVVQPHSYLTLLVNGSYTGKMLHLFANGLEKNPIRGPRKGVVYFGPGYHEPEGGTIQITRKDQTLYLAGGAYVNAMVRAEGARGLTIRGRGIIAQNKNLGDRVSGIVLVDCDDLKVAGVIEHKRQQGWSSRLDSCQRASVTHYKVVSDFRPCTDGLNPRGCGNLTVRRCFFRTGDDCIAIKGFWNTKEYWKMPPNENILIEDCVMFSTHNGCVSFGTETAVPAYRNITIRNCDFLHQSGRNGSGWKAAMAIKMKFGTDIRDILFDDIRVGPHDQLISLLISPHIWRQGNLSRPGDIHRVTFRNIHTDHSRAKDICLRGYDARHVIRDVAFKNLRVKGKLIREAGHPIFFHNRFASFTCSGDESVDKAQSLIGPKQFRRRSDNWAENWQRVCNGSVSDGEAYVVDGNEAWIDFELDEPTRIALLQLYNDGCGPHRTARWKVIARRDGEWQEIFGLRNAGSGWSRVAVRNIAATTLRLVLYPPKDGRVGCYEFACYGEPVKDE
jgi:hypothetical protein